MCEFFIDTDGLRERIASVNDEALLLTEEEYDSAIIGLDYHDKVVYSVKKIIDVLIDEFEMGYTEALEHFDHNIAGAYMGENTPIFVYDINDI